MSDYTIEEYETRLAWLKARSTFIGGSDAAAVLGYDRYRTAWDVFSRKTELFDVIDEPPSEAAAWGIKLEPLVADRYAEATGRKVTGGGLRVYRRADEPFFACTVDRDIEDAPGLGPGVLECKTTSAYNKKLWDTGPTAQAMIQLQHAMYVTGRKWGAAAVLIGGQEFRYTDVRRDDTFIGGVLVPALRAFWFRVKTRTPPPVDGRKLTGDALAKLYQNPTPKAVAQLPYESNQAAQNADASRQEAVEAIKVAEKKKVAAENVIKSLIGPTGCEGVRLGNGVVYTWAEVQRRAYTRTVPESSYRTLRRTADPWEENRQ
jgi:putative phage-type endonuclease